VLSVAEPVLGWVGEDRPRCGEVRRVMPWATPRRSTTRFAALDAMSWFPPSVVQGQAGRAPPLVASGLSTMMCGTSSPWSAQASRSGVAVVASMVAAWSRSK
jgi:hypothetical protein